MTPLQICKTIVNLLRVLNKWDNDSINNIYNLAFNYVRDYTIRIVK